MKKSVMIFTLLAMAVIAASAAGAAGAQKRFNIEERATIRKTLEFSPGNGAKILAVDNVFGSIRVTGYDGRNVEMIANQTIRATSQDRLQTAKREVRLDITDKADTVNIYADQPGHDRSTPSSSRSHWTDHGYEVQFDFEIRVPRQTTIHLWTVNNGDIEVQNIAGDFMVKNINGKVEMRDVSGSGHANTINGDVKAGFAGNPKRDSSFGSLNGTIEAAFQPNLSANLRFKTMNGGVFTDFQVTALPSVMATAERRNGRFVYRSDGFSGARVGNGGPELKFEGLNGDIRILQTK